jgi:uncharacterized membrane protein YqaE (UPF0057 family)
MPIGQTISVLLPPLSVFLREGIGRNFWLSVALTCLGYLPGVIFAATLLVQQHRAAPQAA